MKIEHVAINVEDARATAKWYVEHLDMQVIRSVAEPPYIHFLADKAGQGVIELYSNPQAPFPDYRAMHPLMLHFAFVVDDIEATRARLIEAGATTEGDIEETPRHDKLAMLRDPWGVCIQLVKRQKPLHQ